MNLKFSKYQGTGNDFIVIDNRNDEFPKETDVIQKLCDRNFGIGSDGLILIEEHPEVDYKMIFFNPDGTKSLCGNGSRCGFHFAQTLGMVTNIATFETTDGTHQAEEVNGLIKISLFDTPLPKKMDSKDHYINTGSPHYVTIVDDVKLTDVVSQGRAIRNSEAYSRQNGTNVNFAQLLQDRVLVRTYERGVENETLSCGTGVTAVALVAGELGYASPVIVETAGGQLNVDFVRSETGFKNIWLTGPVKRVFEGTVDIV